VPKKPKKIIRAVQAKLILPRKDTPRARRHRDALDFTTDLMSQAVQHWGQLLLELRQRDVVTGRDDDGEEIIVTGDEWRDRLAQRLGKKVIKKHGVRLHDLYTVIIPSYVTDGAGKAQDAVAKLRPLVSADSKGGELEFNVLHNFSWMVPQCLTKDARKARAKQLGKKVKDVPRVPKAVADRAAGELVADPDKLKTGGRSAGWAKAYNAGQPDWCEKLLAMVEEKHTLYQKNKVLIELRQADVFPLLDPFFKIEGTRGVVTAWDTMALHIAASRLNPWESRRHKMIKAKADLEAELRQHDTKKPGGLAEVEDYEQQLGRRLRSRETYGWDELLKLLLDPKEQRDVPTLLKFVKDKLGRRFGSYETLRAMAQMCGLVTKGNPYAWHRKRNGMLTALERMHTLPILNFGLTQCCYDSPANKNLPQYMLNQAGTQLTVTLPLLEATDEPGQYREVKYHYRLAKTRQLEGCELVLDGKLLRTDVMAQDRVTVNTAILSGIKLLHRAEDYLIQLPLDLHPNRDDALLKRRLELRKYYSAAQSNRKGKEPATGRVLAVDLRCRFAAACAVYTTRGELERSFLLRVPGESPGRKDREYRRQLDRETERLRDHIHKLAELAKTDTPFWKFRKLELEVGEHVQEFLTTYRQVGGGGGLSMWHISALDSILRMHKSWVNHPRPGDEENRHQVGIGKGLQEHLNQLKHERAIVIADLIVQAARGLLYNFEGSRWEYSEHQPVDVVLVDGLHLYRTHRRLPKGENRQLMLWCHRAIAHAIEGQAEIVSLTTTDCATYYSSQVHAASQAPGVTCYQLREHDITSLKRLRERHWLWTRLERLDCDPEQLKVGDWVPDNRGRFLATLRPDGSVLRTDVSISAAQNNAQWYLEGLRNPVSVTGRWDEAAGCGYLKCASPTYQSIFPHMKLVVFEPVVGHDGCYRARKALKGEELPPEKETSKWTLFRDRSGVFWDKGLWVEARPFWSDVEQRIARASGLKKLKPKARATA
jgi:hypothetical protein